MEEGFTERGQPPHAVMFPYPAQGHINPMMQLAKKLLAQGFFITFVNTDFNHNRMFQNGAASSLLDTPNLRFEHVPDGLPPGHGRFNQSVIEITAAILALPGPVAKLLRRITEARTSPPLTCIISDSFCSWMQDVADIFRVPRVSLWTTPVHANLGYHFQSTLCEQGLVPGKDKESLSKVISCIPGIVPMPLADHISFFLVEDQTNFLFQWHLRLCMRRANDAAWNLGNNFEELEGDAVAAWRAEVPSFLPVGPLLPEAVLKGEKCAEKRAGPSLWPEDATACEEWLDGQDPRSVLYVSFGSIATMDEDEVAQLVQGLEESGAPVLWAIRPDQGGAALANLRARMAAAQGAGHLPPVLLVAWAPQLAVLTHPSVGGFLSHCGWNSVVESLSSGVPILAKPGGFAEQCMNARYIADVWRVGLRLPGHASAKVVKQLVKEVMGSEDIRSHVSRVRQAALNAITPPHGPSATNFQRFVDDMRGRANSSHQPST